MRLIDADALERVIMTMPDEELCEDCCYNVVNAIDAFPTLGGWISVKDRLPEEVPWDAKYALIWFYVEKEDGKKIKPESPVIGKYDPFEKTWTVVGLVENMQSRIRITHWIPLPEPPKECEKKKGET